MDFNIFTPISFLAGFALSLIFLFTLRGVLPRDQGRAFAVNGEKSLGKARGAGVIFVPVFCLCSIVFTGFQVELLLYAVLILLAMLTGYLDDRSKIPWGELKKGLLDLALCVAAVAVFFIYHSEFRLSLFSLSVTVPGWLFFLFCVFYLWAFINCCNCTDGVDGLLGTLSLVAFGCVAAILSVHQLPSWACVSLTVVGALLAYLLFNASPSSLMMGDAGSRAIGLTLGILLMQTGNLLYCLPCCIVILLDGGLGLVKLSVMRTFHSQTFMKDIRTPIHDEARKNRHWSDTQTVYRFAIVQAVLGILCVMTLKG